MAKRTWTTEEEQWIIDNRPTLNLMQIAGHFGLEIGLARKKVFDMTKEYGEELMPSKQKKHDPDGTKKLFFRRGEWREYIKENGRYNLLDPHKRSTKPVKASRVKREVATKTKRYSIYSPAKMKAVIPKEIPIEEKRVAEMKFVPSEPVIIKKPVVKVPNVIVLEPTLTGGVWVRKDNKTMVYKKIAI